MTEPITIDNIIRNEPNEVYRKKSSAYLSSHSLADFRYSPLLYCKKKMGLIPQTVRAAYTTGIAVHVFVLEGEDVYDSRYIVGGPVNPKTNKAYGHTTKKFIEWANSQIKQALTPEQDALIRQIASALDTNQEAKNLLSNGIPEAVIRTFYYDTPCQIRMDWYIERKAFVDLKTCDNLTFFEADARRYGYIYQLAFYRSVLEQVIKKHVPVYLIAVEKQEPFRCGVWRIGLDALDQAQQTNENAIERLLECVKTNTWETGYEQTRHLDTL